MLYQPKITTNLLTNLCTSFLISSLFYIHSVHAQFELPNTKIWLVEIAAHETIQASLLTQETAYHNQPAFSHDGNALFYTRGDIAESDGLGYTDIYRLNFDDQLHQQIQFQNADQT